VPIAEVQHAPLATLSKSDRRLPLLLLLQWQENRETANMEAFNNLKR
jgi:hypothetical protein